MRGVFIDPRHEAGCPSLKFEPDPQLPTGEQQKQRKAARLDSRRCKCSPKMSVRVAGEWVDHPRFPKGWTKSDHLEPLEAAWAAKREQHKTGVEVVSRRAKVPMLREWGDARMANYDVLSRIGGEEEYSRNTYDSYMAMWRNHIRPDKIAELRLTAITPEALNEWMARLLAKGLAKSTIRANLSVLTGMLTDAVSEKILAVNPARVERNSRRRRGANVLRVPREKRGELRQRAPRLLELDFAAALIQNTTGVLHDLLILEFSTGLRAAELAGLDWPDIAWATRRVAVERQFGKNGLKEPKYEQFRSVLLWSRVAASLGPRRQAEGPVFLDPDTGKRFMPPKLTKVLATAWAPLGPRPKGHSWHTLRHTYASLLDGAVHDRLIEETMGHRRQDVTSGYIHQFNPAMDAIEGVLEERLGSRLDILADVKVVTT